MRLILFALAAAFLTACAPAETGPAAPSPEAAALPSYTPLRVEGLAVACNATAQARCRAEGCAPETDAPIPVAFSFDGDAGTGELCMATGCHAVFLAPMPADAPSPGDGGFLAAVLAPGTPETAGAGPGPFFDGVISLARDGASFHFMQSGADTMIWSGACAPPPAE